MLESLQVKRDLHGLIKEQKVQECDATMLIAAILFGT
jgi:hypothetical protein